MGKIQELIVTKGKTVKVGDREEWLRIEYSVKASVDDASDLEAAKPHIEGLIDGWLTSPANQTPTATTKPLPKLDPDELEKLPWKTYRTKEPAKLGDPAWIMRETQGAEALADLMEKYEGGEVVVQIGANMYSVRFSGEKKQFIGRAPVKKAGQ